MIATRFLGYITNSTIGRPGLEHTGEAVVSLLSCLETEKKNTGYGWTSASGIHSSVRIANVAYVVYVMCHYCHAV